MSLEQDTQNAKNGTLSVHLNLEQFDEIIKACGVYEDALNILQHDSETLGWHKLGFEDDLHSGTDLAKAFQKKASGASNSAVTTFQSHIDRVHEMKALFEAMRTAYLVTDQENVPYFRQHGH